MRGRLAQVVRTPSFPALLILLVAIVSLAAAKPSLIAAGTGFSILSQASVTLIVAAGFAVALLAGQLDLSVGATAVLAGVVAMRLQEHGLVVSIVGGIVAGAVVGAINGVLVVSVGVPSLLATLGMLIAARGVSFWYSDGRPVQGLQPEVAKWLNDSFLGVLSARLLIAAAIVIVVDTTIRQTVWGRSLVATGGNARAAEAVGINVRSVTFRALVISGTLAAVGGTLQAYLLNSATPAGGETMLVSVIAGVVVGGVGLAGGRGTIAGAAAGVLLIATVTVGMNLIGVESAYQRMLIGVLLLIVVLASAPQFSRSLARRNGGGSPKRVVLSSS